MSVNEVRRRGGGGGGEVGASGGAGTDPGGQSESDADRIMLR